MRHRVIMGIALILISLLAACQPGADTPSSSGEVVKWNKDPYAIVFRAEIVGGEQSGSFVMLNDVPACTLYGDGRLVWVAEGSGARQILFDYISDADISNFISDLAFQQRFYDYKEGFPLLIPSSTSPVYERLTLENNGVKSVSDSFSNWPFDYYNQRLQQCIALSKAPRTFEPDGAWISATRVEYDARTSSIFWDQDAAGLSFNDIAGVQERRWLEGQLVKVLWQAVNENGLGVQIIETEVAFNIALQIPGVTRDAPPAPSAQPAS